MLSDHALAGLCVASYDNSAAWDRLFAPTDTQPVWCAVKKVDNDFVVVFRGSDCLEDWLLDAAAVRPVSHPLLGSLAWGFFDGLETICPEIANFVGFNSTFCGHSLGAARAVLMGALFAAKGFRPARIVGFGCPNTGYGQHARILEKVPGRLYKNRCDPVTDVPLPALGFPWQKAYTQTVIDQNPSQLDTDPSPWRDFNPSNLIEDTVFDDHHVELYLKGASTETY